jgi:putative aminopeptidase FrvX
MTPQKIEHLKEVLSIPTKTYQEELMIEYLVNYLSTKGYDYKVQENGNIYVTKGVADYYPCVIAHTDTVHSITEMVVREEMLPNYSGEDKLSLKAYHKETGKPVGIGGDDKCGVYACLDLLEQLPVLKVALFVSEETGCHGSRKADPEFFSNVGYGIQFDAPENYMITEYCWGVKLFDRDSNFFDKVEPLLEKYIGQNRRLMQHPYTDVSQVTARFNISCINVSCGYYRYHTANEYVVVEDLFNSIDMVKEIIESLGYDMYSNVPKVQQWMLFS